ncbi:MAG: hypothetical protein JEZ04_19335 [Spirochaetales bacterium]|nr:hypothetical protein [Spirochaetales bacterium]
MSDGPKEKKTIKSPADPLSVPVGEFLLYTTEDGQSQVECRFVDETIWLSQALLAELFDRDVRTINEHQKNIFNEKELKQAATIRNSRIVRLEGKLGLDSVVRKPRTTAGDKKSFDAKIIETATCKDYLQVRQERTPKVSRFVKHYNLEALS